MLQAVLLAALTAHPFTPDDWTRLRSAAATDVSKDGRTILYDVSHGVQKGLTAHESWLISRDGSGARKLALPKGFEISGFLPDGGFYGTYAKGDADPQVAVLSANSQTPHVLTHLPHGAGPLTISPDGKWIATIASNAPRDPLAQIRTVVENPIATPYIVRTDGTGGAWWCPSLTDVQEAAWSPDSGTLALLTQNGKIGYHY